MKHLLISLLGQNGFIILNKSLVKELGLKKALTLSFMIDKWKYFNCQDFYYTIETLSEDTGLSERDCRNALKGLIECGAIVKKAFEGVPPKQYYNINADIIITLLGGKSVSVKTCKSDTFNPCKSVRVKTCKSDRDININNNTINNNKVIKTHKEQTLPQSRLESVGGSEIQTSPICQKQNSLFASEVEIKSNNSETAFSFSDFNAGEIDNKGVAYLNTFKAILDSFKCVLECKRELGLFLLARKETKKPITPRGLTMLLNKLQGFSSAEARREALVNSVINGWAGVFEPRAKVKGTSYNAFNQYDKGDNTAYYLKAMQNQSGKD